MTQFSEKGRPTVGDKVRVVRGKAGEHQKDVGKEFIISQDKRDAKRPAPNRACRPVPALRASGTEKNQTSPQLIPQSLLGSLWYQPK